MYPNGNKGRLAALLAVCGLFACNPGGELLPQHPQVHCDGGTCENVVTLVRPLPAVASDVPGLSVRVCRNEVCAVSQPVAATDGSFGCSAFGLLVTSCVIQPATGGGLELRISFIGPVTDLHDGDRYLVQVSSQSGTILDVPATVTYTEARPNGPDCEPLCRSASL